MSNHNIKHVLLHANNLLSHYDSAKLDAEILLAHCIDKSRSFIYAHPEYELNTQQTKHYFELIQQRQSGVPVAYLRGTQDFWSMPFTVNSDVLIPRPETEILVESILDRITRQPNIVRQKTLLDLGTGSGCIAVAFAKELADWHITAIDQSQPALTVAKQNARNNKTDNIQFIQSNWFSNAPDTTYDVVVSNPPYIAANDSELENNVLQFEPRNALIAPDNGLSDYKTIIKQAPDYMHKDSLLAFEIGYTQAEAIQNLLINFRDIQTVNDLQNHNRVISALL